LDGSSKKWPIRFSIMKAIINYYLNHNYHIFVLNCLSNKITYGNIRNHYYHCGHSKLAWEGSPEGSYRASLGCSFFRELRWQLSAKLYLASSIIFFFSGFLNCGELRWGHPVGRSIWRH
jgi:hypothetical protein